MMQDYAKLLDKNAIVGFSEFQRWTSFSAVKNARSDAVAKQQGGNAPESGASGECDYYLWAHRILKEAGVTIEDPKPLSYKGVNVEMPAKIVLTPAFGVTQAEVKSKFTGGASVKLYNDSTLVLDGANITVKALDVHGTLVIHAVEGAKVSIDGLTVNNGGWSFAELGEDEGSVDQIYQIRGYSLDKKGQEVYTFDKPGDYTLSDATKQQFTRSA